MNALKYLQEIPGLIDKYKTVVGSLYKTRRRRETRCRKIILSMRKIYIFERETALFDNFLLYISYLLHLLGICVHFCR